MDEHVNADMFFLSIHEANKLIFTSNVDNSDNSFLELGSFDCPISAFSMGYDFQYVAVD